MKKLFFLLLGLIALGCGQQQPQRPDNLLPQDKMVQILADIHTAEALIEQKAVYPDTALLSFNYAEKKIFERYNVTEQDFRQTYRFYSDNVREMDKLYEVVIDTLSMRETKAKAQGTATNPDLPAE